MPQRNAFQNESRRMALGGVLGALSVVLMSLGGFIPLATFVCPMLAMICLIPLMCRYGRRTALTVYVGVGILSLLLCVDKEMAFFYVFLGWYPAVRSRVERISARVLRIVLKCAVFSGAMAAMYLLLIFLFRLEAVAAEFAEYSAWYVAGLLVLGNVTFLLFDRVLGQLTLVYRYKFMR